MQNTMLSFEAMRILNPYWVIHSDDDKMYVIERLMCVKRVDQATLDGMKTEFETFKRYAEGYVRKNHANTEAGWELWRFFGALPPGCWSWRKAAACAAVCTTHAAECERFIVSYRKVFSKQKAAVTCRTDRSC